MTMFTSGTTRVVLFFLLSTATAQDSSFNHGCSEPMSRDAAAACCRARGSVPPLPMPMTLADNNLLYDRLMNVSMNGTWLGLTRIKMNKYQWVNGTEDEFHVDEADRSCVALNMTSKVKEAEFCNTEDHGYICERKGCDGCASLGIWKDFCVRERGRCFIILCERESWFNARSRCIGQGWDLASTANIPVLSGTSRCPLYWIGLRREKWIQGDGIEVVNHTSWGVGQPAGDGKCAVFKLLPSAGYGWIAGKCSELKSFICQSYNGVAGSQNIELMTTSEATWATSTIDLGTIDSSTEESSVAKGYQLAIIISTVLAAIAFVFFTIFGWVYAWKKRTKKRNSVKLKQSFTRADIKDTPIGGQHTDRAGNTVKEVEKPLLPEETVAETGSRTRNADTTDAQEVQGIADTHQLAEIPLLSEQTAVNSCQGAEGLLPAQTKGKEETIRQELAEEYSKFYGFADHFSWDRSLKHLPLEQIYTDLVWTHEKRSNKRLECYSDMLQQEDEGYIRVLLRGEAGTGKTTLCRKIVTDWANTVLNNEKGVAATIKEALQKFQNIVLITLRYVWKGQTLENIIFNQLKLKKESCQELMKEIEVNQSGSLFILDGYDEYDPKTSDEVEKLVNRNLFPGVNLLVTSRPLPFNLVSEQNAYIKEASLFGFSKDVGVQMYVHRYFKDEERDFRSEELLTKIRESSDLSFLSVFPAILHLMCILWKEQEGQLCTTLTSFYESFVKYICERHDQKRRNLAGEHSSSPHYEDVLVKYEANLMDLGKLSVSGTKGPRLKLTFSEEQVNNILQESSLDLGLLKQEQSGKSRKKQYFGFIHKTIQEYFAAFYIARSPEPLKRKLLQQLFGSADPLIESTMTIRFLAGLDSQSVSDMIKHVNRYNTAVGTHMMITLLAENKEFLKEKRLPKEVSVKLNPLYTTEALICFLKLDGSATTEILVETNNAESCWLLVYLNTPKLEKLIIKRNSSLRPIPEIDQNIKNTLEIPFTTVLTYELRDFCWSDVDFMNTTILCKELPKAVKIESLDFSGTFILAGMGKILTDAFAVFEGLKSLRLRGCGINEEVLAETMLRSLAKVEKNSLQVLDLSANKPNYSVLQTLLELLPKVRKLRELCIFDINPNEVEIELSWENLNMLKSLTTLDVGTNCITKNGYNGFCSGLRQLKKLDSLRLRSPQTISNDHLSEIILVLINLRSLKSLDLCSNPVDEHTLTSLSELLKWGSIEALIVKYLSDNLTAKNAFAFLKNANNYKTLKKLEFPGAVIEEKMSDFLRLPSHTFLYLRELIPTGLQLTEQYSEVFIRKTKEKFPKVHFRL